MSEQVRVKGMLPTSVEVDHNVDTCQSVIEKIAEENIARYGIASGIYAKTDYDLSDGYKDDINRLYLTIKMTTDALAEGASFSDQFALAKISATSQVGFRNWLTDLFDNFNVANGMDTDRVRESLNATKHNADLFINCLDDAGELGTKGAKLLTTNVELLYERLTTIVNRIDAVLGGATTEEAINACSL